MQFGREARGRVLGAHRVLHGFVPTVPRIAGGEDRGSCHGSDDGVGYFYYWIRLTLVGNGQFDSNTLAPEVVW